MDVEKREFTAPSWTINFIFDIYRGFARRGTHFRAHDAATSHDRAHGFFFHSAVWRKTTATLDFRSVYGKSCNFHLVCVVIFLPLGYNLVMWFELNKKLWNILLLFPKPSHSNGKPTWWLWVWWFAKFAWYNVTWNPLLVHNSWPMVQLLPCKVKMQYVHHRLIASYFLFSWRNPSEMCRRTILFHN